MSLGYSSQGSCSSNVVKVYDSLYDEVDDVVQELITNLFLFSVDQYPVIEMVPILQLLSVLQFC